MKFDPTLYGGRTAAQLLRDELLLLSLIPSLRQCLFVIALCLMVGAFGCAEVKVYQRDGITMHANDLSACATHASGCTTPDGKNVYYSEFDLAALDHEFVFHAKNHGKHKEPWLSYNGIPYTLVTDAGTNMDWRNGDCMMRTDAGPVRKCDGRIKFN